VLLYTNAYESHNYHSYQYSHQSLINHVRGIDEFIVAEKSILISVIKHHNRSIFIHIFLWDIFIDRLFSLGWHAFSHVVLIKVRPSTKRATYLLDRFIWLWISTLWMTANVSQACTEIPAADGINDINVSKRILNLDFVLWIYI